jgi:hypothetical protein
MSSTGQSGGWFGTVDADRPQAQRTNPLAIASLVLSVVWCAGIGSVLAIVVAIQARRSIRASDGAETGEGLATAGMIIGILGVVGAVITTALVVALTITATNVAENAIQRFGHRQVDVSAGRTVNLTGSDFSIDRGIRTVTVSAVLDPVSPPSGSSLAQAGREFAVADIQICAGSGGSQEGVTSSLFFLEFAGGDRVTTSGTAAKEPDLSTVQGMAPRQCLRGYLTFEIATGTRPTAVIYEPDPLRSYRWSVPNR